MSRTPTPTIDERVKVSILPEEGATEEVELDYRMFIMGSFSGHKPGEHRDGESLKDRRVREIRNKRDFKTVMEQLGPKLDLRVANKVSGEEGEEMQVELDIKSMKGFHPDEIARQVEPLKKLLEARDRLKALKMSVLRDVKVKKDLEKVLKEGSDSIDDLLSKLGGAETDK